MTELRRSTRLTEGKKPKVGDVESKVVKKVADKGAKKSVDPPVKSEESGTKQLEVGDSIPDITLLDDDENEVNLKDAASKTKFLVIFAYPKASTPGCTRQVCGFQRNFEFLQKNETTVFGLSADKPSSQKNFVKKQGLQYHLLSDPSKKLIGVLGAKKSPSGIKRSHWIFVDGKLKIKKIQISPEESFNSAKIDIESLLGSS